MVVRFKTVFDEKEHVEEDQYIRKMEAEQREDREYAERRAKAKAKEQQAKKDQAAAAAAKEHAPPAAAAGEEKNGKQ